MGKRLRKYNQIISCDRTPNGYWKIYVKTPHDQIYHHLYVGYSPKEALRKARRTNFDRGTFFNQPSR